MPHYPSYTLAAIVGAAALVGCSEERPDFGETGDKAISPTTDGEDAPTGGSTSDAGQPGASPSPNDDTPTPNGSGGAGGRDGPDPSPDEPDEGPQLSDCPGCRIDGECVATATLNPDNPCEMCDPDVDTAQWSPRSNATCDDGLYCTVDDACVDGECTGAPRECDDGVECNGESTCDETAAECTPGESRCGAEMCDVATDSCVSECDGCSIDGQCVPADAVSPSNPCLVCAPALSSDDYSVAEGRACGASAEECSAQDTCDAAGACQANHLSGTPCESEAFCAASAACDDGVCVPQGMRECSANEVCDESADQCVCGGCMIGDECVAAGDVDPSNLCLVCTPTTNDVAYTPSVGKACGSSATECSEQDTCDANGVCQANHLDDGAMCSLGECSAGNCVEVPNPFDCIAPTPPAIDEDALEVISVGGSPPAPAGGSIQAGRYVPFRVQFYGDQPSTTSTYSFEFEGRFVQAAHQPYPPWVPQVEFAGGYAIVNNTLQFEVERCDPQYLTDLPSLEYTATANGLVTFETNTNFDSSDPKSTRVVISYRRE